MTDVRTPHPTTVDVPSFPATSSRPTLADRFRARRPEPSRSELARYVALGGGWLASGGIAMLALAAYLQHQPFPTRWAVVAAIVVWPMAASSWRANRRIGERIASETEALLRDIPDADVRFEAHDVRVRLSTFGSIEWMGADVVLTRDRLILLPYGRTAGWKMAQPAMQGDPTSCALQSDGTVTLQVPSRKKWAGLVTVTISEIDGKALIAAISRA